MHTPCQSHNLPVQSKNYKVFQRNTWITKKLVYHPILSLPAGCEFTRQHCHSFWYFITCIHFNLFQMWSVSVVCLHCSFYWKRSTVLLTGISGSTIDFMTDFFASLFPLKNSSLSVLYFFFDLVLIHAWAYLFKPLLFLQNAVSISIAVPMRKSDITLHAYWYREDEILWNSLVFDFQLFSRT